MFKSSTTSVDVIMPTKGRVPYFLEALETVVGQKHRPVRLIVVDDGCSEEEVAQIDRALATANNESDQFNAVRIVHAGAGAAAARNAGFRHGQSPFVLWVDSDDWLLPHKLEHDLDLLNTTGSDFVVSRAQHKRNGKLIDAYWGDEVQHDQAQFIFPFQTMCALYQRSFISKNQLHWNERLDTTNDWEFSNRALLASKKMKFAANVTATYRQPNSTSQSLGSALNLEKITSQLLSIDKVLRLKKRAYGKIGAMYKVKHIRHAWFLLGEAIKRGNLRTTGQALRSMARALIS
jgi:glycosyltransferase involved in cell wall biosynthesis